MQSDPTPATPVPDMVDAVDREAAAGIAQLHFLYPTDTIDRIRSGELDHLAIVNICARHRIAALTACRAQVEQQERDRIVAWLREEGTLQIDTGYDAGVYGGQGMHFAADQIEAGVEHRSADNG